VQLICRVKTMRETTNRKLCFDHAASCTRELFDIDLKEAKPMAINARDANSEAGIYATTLMMLRQAICQRFVPQQRRLAADSLTGSIGDRHGRIAARDSRDASRRTWGLAMDQEMPSGENVVSKPRCKVEGNDAENVVASASPEAPGKRTNLPSSHEPGQHYAAPANTDYYHERGVRSGMPGKLANGKTVAGPTGTMVTRPLEKEEKEKSEEEDDTYSAAEDEYYVGGARPIGGYRDDYNPGVAQSTKAPNNPPGAKDALGMDPTAMNQMVRTLLKQFGLTANEIMLVEQAYGNVNGGNPGGMVDKEQAAQMQEGPQPTEQKPPMKPLSPQGIAPEQPPEKSTPSQPAQTFGGVEKAPPRTVPQRDASLNMRCRGNVAGDSALKTSSNAFYARVPGAKRIGIA
jgi:hypothetical protein